MSLQVGLMTFKVQFLSTKSYVKTNIPEKIPKSLKIPVGKIHKN